MEGVRSAEWVVCTLWEALAVGMALYAEKCLLLSLLEKTGVLPVDGFQDCQMDKSVPLVLLCRKEDSNDEDHDHGKPMDDNGNVVIFHKESYNDDHVNGIEDHIPGGDGTSSDGDQEPEDYSGSHNDRRSDDNEENEDGDGDGDGDDDDDTDMEDCYDEDEEETDEEDEDESEDDISTSGDGTDDNDQYPLLKHAKDVYTSDDFRLFEDECKKMKTLDIDVKDDMGLTARGVEITYEVGKQWQYHRGYTVAVLPFDGIVECTCKYFEFSGILCCHAQAALSCLRIDKIPDRCIVQKDKNPLTAPAEEVDTSKKNQEECSYQSTDVETRINFTDPPLLRHARDVFNSNIFDMFKEEYKKSEYYFAREVGVSDAGELKVKHKVEKPGSYRCHMVLAAADTGRAICNCKKFKKTQLLCRHVIVVLDYLCIVKIPGHYILDKYKKDECVSIVQEIHGPEYAGLRSFLLSRAMNSTFNESLDEGCVSEECARLWELFTYCIMHKMRNPDGKVVVKNPRVASGSSKRDTSPDGAADN